MIKPVHGGIEGVCERQRSYRKKKKIFQLQVLEFLFMHFFFLISFLFFFEGKYTWEQDMVLLDQTSPDRETRDNREEKYLQLLRWTISGLDRAD